MAEDRTRLIEAVDQLAVQARLVKYDDLMGLGALLEKLEAVEGFTSGPDQTLTRLLCESLETLLKRVILNKSSSPKQEMELFAEGMKWVRQRVMLSDSPSLLPEEVSFLENSKRVMGETGPTSERKKEELPSQESSQTSFDLTQDLGLYRDFISEALEHLETIELNIIELEQSPDDKECISNIFRPFHTIKGVSGFLNLRDINRFSHSMESLLDLARNDEIKIHREIVDFILEAVDFLKKMILDLRTHLEQGQTAFSHFDLTPYLKRIASFQQGEEPTPSSPEPGRPFEAREQSFGPPLGEILRSKGIISPDQVNSALQRQSEMRKDQKIGQILVNEFDVKPVEVISALRDQKRVTSQEVETTVKVTTSKLDNLVDLVGELVITQALVQQNPAFSSLQDQKLAQDFSQLKRITTDLQRNSMSLRMIPIRHTFQKMIRLIRDLAQKSNKLVELCMSGEDTEIDRNMVDSLYDPLVHMIRNSIDHGIESPEVRKEKGKPEAGTILLKAYQKGGNVVIEVEDDGQGLNRTKILQKAKDRGLVSDEVQLTDHQIDNLIFEAGFSTAERVTDVSGRGVGLDVVKKAVERLRGRVEIFSVEQKGCRFVLRIPLTLAILDGIIVRIGKDRFIIPTIFIKEALRPQRSDISTVEKKGELVKIRNTLAPLIRLHGLLGIIPEKAEPWESLVIVVESEGQQRCLMVDDLLGKQEVVIKNLGEKLKEVKGVAGATIMGDGRVGLILDIHGIFNMDQASC